MRDFGVIARAISIGRARVYSERRSFELLLFIRIIVSLVKVFFIRYFAVTIFAANPFRSRSIKLSSLQSFNYRFGKNEILGFCDLDVRTVTRDKLYLEAEPLGK